MVVPDRSEVFGVTEATAYRYLRLLAVGSRGLRTRLSMSVHVAHRVVVRLDWTAGRSQGSVAGTCRPDTHRLSVGSGGPGNVTCHRVPDAVSAAWSSLPSEMHSARPPGEPSGRACQSSG
jgi:hypothetical protein